MRNKFIYGVTIFLVTLFVLTTKTFAYDSYDNDFNKEVIKNSIEILKERDSKFDRHSPLYSFGYSPVGIHISMGEYIDNLENSNIKYASKYDFTKLLKTLEENNTINKTLIIGKDENPVKTDIINQFTSQKELEEFKDLVMYDFLNSKSLSLWLEDNKINNIINKDLRISNTVKINNSDEDIIAFNVSKGNIYKYNNISILKLPTEDNKVIYAFEYNKDKMSDEEVFEQLIDILNSRSIKSDTKDITILMNNIELYSNNSIKVNTKEYYETNSDLELKFPINDSLNILYNSENLELNQIVGVRFKQSEELGKPCGELYKFNPKLIVELDKDSKLITFILKV